MKRGFLLLLLVFNINQAHAGSVDVLVTAANDGELQPLIARLADLHTETRAAWTFWTGRLGGKSVVLTRTEGDPLNAVAATTLGIHRYAPRLVITFGTARPHDPALHNGDLVVSGKFAAFDGFYSHVKPAGGGVDPLQWRRLPHLLMSRGEEETPAYSFPADATALALAGKLSDPTGRVVIGVLGSANQVNAEADRIAWLRTHWGTSCEDGESAHIAGCAELLGVPVIGLRIIVPVGAASGGQAETDAAAVVLQLLEKLP